MTHNLSLETTSSHIFNWFIKHKFYIFN